MEIIEKSFLQRYLQSAKDQRVDSAAAAFYASLDQVKKVSPLVAEAIIKELKDQRNNLKLIASENFSSLATQLSMGNWLTDKYAEGYAHHRFYAGCDNVDTIEAEASRLACELFKADHAYVQPHSGADANLVAFIAILSAKVQQPLMESFGGKDPRELSKEDWLKVREKMNNQKLMALDYYSGGHLTHGYRFNFSSQLFDVYSYTVDPESKLLDLDQVRKQAHEIKPTILLAGYSAYPRKINFAKMREIADEVGAVFMVDMAHFAGLVAGEVFTDEYNPIPYAHVVTTTTHKTLRGPRGGMVLCKKEYAEWVDRGCPYILGGPLPHMMAAKAVAFQEALKPAFKDYAHKIVQNAQSLAEALISEGMEVVSGGTDNHLMLVDVAKTFNLTGRQAEGALRSCGLTLNRNSLPFDVNGAWYTSGLRIGTPAVTTLGMGPAEMKEIARIIKKALENTRPAKIKTKQGDIVKSPAKYKLNEEIIHEVMADVKALLEKYPLYPELDLEIFSQVN